MPTYDFRARTRDGSSLRGIRVAADEAALARDLALEGAFLVRASFSASDPLGGLRKPKVKRKELVAFMLHLGSYLEAGVPILAALDDYRVPENRLVDAAIQDLRRRVEAGSSLSEAMELHPTLFKPLIVNMVKAGEASGKLDESIREVIKLVEWEEAFAAQVKQASLYPAIVLTIMALAFTAVTVFALPAILKLLRELNVPLPLPTRVFMLVGDFLASYGWIAVLAVVLGITLFRLLLRNEEVRLWWDTKLLGMPLLGPVVTKLGLSRFATFFASQYRAGLPIVQVLRECQAITGNARLSLCVHRIRQGVEAGERLGVLAAQVGYFPRLVVRMLTIGEETGNLETTLGKVSKYFDEDVRASIRRFFQLLEPAILILIAVLLVFTALAILLPIYMSIGNINAQVH